jgi:hypothetical protein
VALGFLGRLRPRIFSTFSTTRVVGHQLNALAAFNPGEIPGTHFQRLSRPQGTRFCWKEPRKKFQVTPSGIDPGTVRLLAQHLNHYATSGPTINCYQSYLVLQISVPVYSTVIDNHFHVLCHGCVRMSHVFTVLLCMVECNIHCFS